MRHRMISLFLTASVLLMSVLCGCSTERRKTRGSNYIGRNSEALEHLTKEPETTPEPLPTDTITPSDPVDPSDPSDPSDPTNTSRSSHPKVGISLPTKNIQRWQDEGDALKQYLEEDGDEVILSFADNNVQLQIDQIASMIAEDCTILVIASVDYSSLYRVLDAAKQKNITVISYDRLIMDTDNVDYYVSFDNYEAGRLQALYIIDKLDLMNVDGPFNIEIFTGDPSSDQTHRFYEGAMDKLAPFIASGKLNVVSGQTEFEDVAIPGWSTDQAQNRMEALIATCYSDADLHAVLCPNDTIALGVTKAMEAGYIGNYPIITGGDCDLPNVRNILNDKQSMSLLRDTMIMVKLTVEVIRAIIADQPVPYIDQRSINNGKKDVPALLAQPEVIDKNNYRILITSGFYTEDELS